VVVEDRTITVQIRNLGDGYQRRSWQRAMLDRRRRDSSGAFVLDPDDALLELTHALITGGPPTPGDVRRLDELARAAGKAAPPIEDQDAAHAWLEAALRSRGFAPDAGSADDRDRRPGARNVLAAGLETTAVVTAGLARDGLDRVRRSLEAIGVHRQPPDHESIPPD
jgi:hypothetical protein